MFSKRGFTLAEVLITLGIIGVVAVMTLPTLIANYEKKVVATKAKKAYSELLNAIKMSESHNGEMKEWPVPTTGVQGTRDFVNEYIKPYYVDLKECSTGNNQRCGVNIGNTSVNYITSNGTGISMIVMSANGSINVMIDTNGKGQPNTVGKDAFKFNTASGQLLPYGWLDGLTKDNFKNGYNLSNGQNIACNQTDSAACTAYLMFNNWEIDKDYPW